MAANGSIRESVGMSSERKLVVRVSAHRWRRIEDVIGRVGWVLVALMVPFIVLAKQGHAWATPVAAVFGVLGFTAVSLSNSTLPSWWAGAREVKAGYTTLLLPHRSELDLVEPTTGIVIRAAGEKALTEEEYKAAVLEARSRRQG